jgi:hypothetical protein
MSQNPRQVTTAPGITVAWGQPGCSFFLRWGTMLDVVPGTKLETAIGSGNLSGVIPPSDPRRSDHIGAPTLSKAALTN